MSNQTAADFGECLLTTYPLQCPPALMITLVLKCIVVSFISVAATTCNLVFIIAFRRSPTLHSIPNRLLSYLAMSDFLMSALAMPLYVIRGVLELFSMPICVLFNTERLLIVLLSPASFSLLFLISCERFLAVVFPFKYPYWCNEKRVKIWFGFALLFSVLFLPILLLDVALYYAIFGVIVCVIVVQILTIYAVLYRAARAQKKKVRAMRTRLAPRNGDEPQEPQARFPGSDTAELQVLRVDVTSNSTGSIEAEGKQIGNESLNRNTIEQNAATTRKETESHIPEIEGNGSHVSERAGKDVMVTRKRTPEAINYEDDIKDYKTEKTIAVILLVMILCYLPAIVFVLYVLAVGASVYSWNIYGSWFVMLVLLNCLCNPCIYYWRNTDIRRAMINVLPNCCCRVSPRLP